MPCLRGRFQQGRHGWAFVDEDADVPLRLGQGQGALQRHERGRDVAACLVGERLQHQDLDDAPPAPALFRRLQEALQEAECGAHDESAPSAWAGQQQPGQGDVVELAQVAELVVGRDVLARGPTPAPRPAVPARPTAVPSWRGSAGPRGSSRSHTAARPRRAARGRRRDPPRPRRTRAMATRDRYGFCARPACSPSSLLASRCCRAAGQIVPLTEQLAHPHVHVRRSAKRRPRPARSRAAALARRCAWPPGDGLARSGCPRGRWQQPTTSARWPAFSRLATASAHDRCAVSRSPLVQSASARNPAAPPRSRWSSSPTTSSARRAWVIGAGHIAGRPGPARSGTWRSCPGGGGTPPRPRRPCPSTGPRSSGAPVVRPATARRPAAAPRRPRARR